MVFLYIQSEAVCTGVSPLIEGFGISKVWSFPPHACDHGSHKLRYQRNYPFANLAPTTSWMAAKVFAMHMRNNQVTGESFKHILFTWWWLNWTIYNQNSDRTKLWGLIGHVHPIPCFYLDTGCLWKKPLFEAYFLALVHYCCQPWSLGFGCWQCLHHSHQLDAKLHHWFFMCILNDFLRIIYCP